MQKHIFFLFDESRKSLFEYEKLISKNFHVKNLQTSCDDK